MHRTAQLLMHLRRDVLLGSGSHSETSSSQPGATGVAPPSAAVAILRRCFDVLTRLAGARGMALLLLEAGCVPISLLLSEDATKEVPPQVSTLPSSGPKKEKQRSARQQQQQQHAASVSSSAAVDAGLAAFSTLDAVYKGILALVGSSQPGDERNCLSAAALYDYLVSTFVKLVAVLLPMPSADEMARRLLGAEASTASPGAWAQLVEPVRTHQKVLQAVIQCCLTELMLLSGNSPSCCAWTFRMPSPLLLLHYSDIRDRVVTIGEVCKEDTLPVMQPFRLRGVDVAPSDNDGLRPSMVLAGQSADADHVPGGEAPPYSRDRSLSPLAVALPPPPSTAVAVSLDVLFASVWVPGDVSAACAHDTRVARALLAIAKRAVGNDDVRNAVRMRRGPDPQSPGASSAESENVAFAASLVQILLSGLMLAHALPDRAWKFTDTVSSEIAEMLTAVVLNQLRPIPSGVLAMGYSFALVQPAHQALLTIYGAAAVVVQRAARRHDLNWLYAWRRLMQHPVLPSRFPGAAWEFLQSVTDFKPTNSITSEPHEGSAIVAPPSLGSSPPTAAQMGASPTMRLRPLRKGPPAVTNEEAVGAKRLRLEVEDEEKEAAEGARRRIGDEASSHFFQPKVYPPESLDTYVKRLWLYCESCAAQTV
jgi:hypothetical protein